MNPQTLCLQAIGFDMDYTLAQYKPDTFEALAHSHTVGGWMGGCGKGGMAVGVGKGGRNGRMLRGMGTCWVVPLGSWVGSWYLWW